MAFAAGTKLPLSAFAGLIHARIERGFGSFFSGAAVNPGALSSFTVHLLLWA
jgi:hypothetical protein